MTLTAFLAAHLSQAYAMGALLLLSAGFSGSETALFSLRPASLVACRRRGDWRDRCLLRLRREQEDVLYTILLGNLVVNVAYFAISAALAMAAQESLGVSWAVGLSAFLLLLLIVGSEVLPKSVGAVLQLPVCRLTAAPLLALHVLLSPLCFCLKKTTAYFQRAFLPPAPPVDPQENLRLLFEHYRGAGVVNPDECDFLSAVVDLNDIRVHEIMTPRVDLVAVNADATAEELLALARASRHSKIPVRGADNDQLIGWVDARDFFFADATPAIKDKLKPFLFLSEFTTAEAALRSFLAGDVPLAVVVDERGADAGILVLTDIMGAIFGEFGEAGAPAPEPVREDGAGAYLLDCQVPARYLRDIVGADVRLPGVGTVGGLVTALLGRTAKTGDQVPLGKFVLTVAEVARRRPVTVRLSAENQG